MLTHAIYPEENEVFQKFNSPLDSTFLYLLVLNYGLALILLQFSHLLFFLKKSQHMGKITLNSANIVKIIFI